MQNWQPRRDFSDHKDDASRSWTTLPQWHCWVASTLFSWGFAIRSEPSAFNVTLILVEFRTKKQPERNPGELLHQAQHILIIYVGFWRVQPSLKKQFSIRNDVIKPSDGNEGPEEPEYLARRLLASDWEPFRLRYNMLYDLACCSSLRW